ncbi:MAG TPA: DNA replication and repair protein RecF [Gemmatimonadaceae bacterium]
MSPTSGVGPDGRVLLERLTVRDFRNIARLDLRLPADGLVVIGENGHGKTNLLEAIYYLALLRSVRGARDADLVRFGEAGFHIAADVALDSHREIAVGFDRQGKRKRVRLDGAETPRMSEALGALPAVMFAPRDVDLVAGAPSERRRFLDVALALTSRPYLLALQRYRAALAHRNAALRDAARTGRGDARIAVWDAPLAEHGATLWTARVAWVRDAAPRFAERCAAIGERAPVRMRYATPLLQRAADGTDAAAGATHAAHERGAVADALLAALASGRPHDLRRGITHAGPHRDDLELTIAGRDLRTFGSAGQQRTAAIALRMLEAETLRAAVGRAPVFLLDDPFAELDARRAHRILELLARSGLGQTVLTVPRASDIPQELTSLERMTIRDGVLEPHHAEH